MSDVFYATKKQVNVKDTNQNDVFYATDKQQGTLKNNAVANLVNNNPMPNVVKAVGNNQKIVDDYKKNVDLKTTIPSVNYNQDDAEEQRLKKEMEDAKKTYETTKNSDNRTFLEKTLDRIGGISDDSAKNDYEAKKKEYENYKKIRYYSLLPNGNYKTTNPNNEKYGSKIISDVDWKYEYINNNSDTRKFVDAYRITDDKAKYDKYAYMTEREKGIYNYLYSEKGKEAANDFLEFLDEDLQERLSSKNIEKAYKFADEHPYASAALSVPINIISGSEQAKKSAEYIFTGKMDRDETADMANILRGALPEKVNWEIGNFDAFDFLYNTAMSGVDSLVMAPLGSVGAVSLGLTAAASTTNDIIDRGGSNEQAFWGGIAAGVFEGFFEKFSIGQLNKMQEGAVKGFKDYAKNLSKSMLTNASEETATEIANILYDYAANGGISQYSLLVKEYMQEEGLNETDAKKKAAQKLGLQILEAGASGALMGFGFGSIGSAISYNNYKKNPEYQKVKINKEILNLVDKVKKGDFKANDKVYLESVTPEAAKTIQEITGIDVTDFKVAIEARQIEHILKDHGAEGKADQSLSDDIDIAKMGYILSKPDDIRKAGKTKAYTYMKNGRNKTADTVLYEKVLDKNSYYVVQAIPDTKAKTLYVVSAFIGKPGYKKEASQLIDANNLNATSENGSAIASNPNIPQNDTGVNNIISESGADNSQKTIAKDSIEKLFLSNANKNRHHTTKAEQDFIKEICNALGREVVFEHMTPTDTGIIPDGYIDKNGVIHIGFTVTDHVTFVLKHELTHFGEGTEQYEKFINAVESSRLFKEWIIEAVGERVSDKTDLELLITAYGELVADSRNGDNTDWKAEMYADFVGDCLFNDNGSGLKALLESVDSKHRPAFIQYILDFLSYLKTKLSGNNELTFEMIREISSLEDVFRKMLQEANSNEQNRIKEKTFSFARVKDNSIIEQAENMEEQGANREEIWHTLNVIRDSAGEWIYEIADNEIQFFPEGDAINELPSELEEYYKLANLGRMTAEKRSRFDELRKKYGLAFFRKGKLQDFLKHDKLFEKYPRLKETNLEFKIISTPAHYNPATDTIVLNAERLLREKGLKGSDKMIDDIVREIEFEEDIVHEIEHALQKYEDRERGASPEFWNARLLRGERLPINPETNKEYTPREAYMATNGEYEARESANRKNMNEEERREVVPDLGWGKTISAKEPALVKNQRISQSLDFEYISAVENADIETAQRLTDEVANAMGYTERLYHQTGAEFTEFNTKNQKAGKYDNELPTGTFLKPSNADIGLKGKKQMELYAKIKNPLTFENREAARKFWEENIPDYSEADKKIRKIDSEYRLKTDEAMDNVRAYLKEWRNNNPGVDSREIYQDKRYQELNDYEDSIVDEWEEKSNSASLEAKKIIDNYISKSGYDGVIIEKDQGSGGRYTKSYIVFSSNQLKDASPVTYDDKRNVIALSERFNEEKGDIRYSIPRNNGAITKDMTDSERYESLKNRKLSVAQAKEEVYGEVMNNYPELLNKRLKETDAKKILKKIGEEFNVFHSYENSDIQVSFEFGKNNLNESVHKQKSNYNSYAQMLSCFSDVISNAVGIEVHNRNKEGYKPDLTLKNVYVLCSAFDNGSNILPVKLEIKEFTDKPNRLYVAVALESIKKDRVKSMGVPNNRSHVRTSPVNISIRDLFSKINTNDKNFIKYIPDGFLTEEQISAKTENIGKKFSIPNELRTSLRMYKEGKISYEEYQEVLDVLWNNALTNIQDKDLVQRLQKELEDQKEITMNTAINSARYANQLKKRIKRQNEQLKEQNEEIKRYNEVVTPYGTVSFGKNLEAIRSVFSRIETRRRANSDKKHIPEKLKPYADKLLIAFSRENPMPFDKESIEDLRKEYQNLSELTGFDIEIVESLEELSENIHGKTIKELSFGELIRIRQVSENCWHMMQDVDEVFTEGKRQTIKELGERALVELTQKNVKRGNVFTKAYDSTAYNNMLPIYFFEKFKGVFYGLFDTLMDGEDINQRHLDNSKTFVGQTKEKYNYSKWKDDDIKPIITEHGKEVRLSVEQTMLLYATYKREKMRKNDQTEHILEGGITVPKRNTIKDIIDKLKNSDEKGAKKLYESFTEELYTGAIAVSKVDVAKLVNQLTEEQKEYVDTMVKYLSVDMAALGNQTSMEFFGYCKYNDKYYIPFCTDENYLNIQIGTMDGNNSSLKHSSFTHNLSKGAKTPLVMGNFSEVCADHINKMCRYNASAVTLDAMLKVLNYKSDNGKSVSAEIKKVYGNDALKYLTDFLQKMNGTGNKGGLSAAVDKLIGLYRKNAVSASLSVAVQQPTSLPRAWLEINPKYFVGKSPKSDYEEMLKYCPVGSMKERGRVDIGTGAATVDWILKQEPKTLMEKSKAFVDVKDSSYRDDFFMGLASKGDEWTWRNIWTAVKRETAAKTKLKAGTDDFYKACNKRFRYIINKTQVYDSPISKSKIMSNGPFSKIFTAFAAEPTVWANALMNMNKRNAAKTISLYILSGALNAALKSLVSAPRDDDEEKTYWEKYSEDFVEGFWDNINPATNIPILRDFISIKKGYDVERPDMSAITDLFDAYQALGSDKKNTYRKIEDFAGALAAFAGLPVKNVMRDVRAAYNFYTDMFVNDYENREVNIEVAGYMDELYDNYTFEAFDDEDKETLEARITDTVRNVQKAKGNKTSLQDFDELYELLRKNKSAYNKLRQKMIDEGKYTANEITDGVELARIAYMKSQGVDIHEYLLFKMATNKKHADINKNGSVDKEERKEAIGKMDLDSKIKTYFINDHK